MGEAEQIAAFRQLINVELEEFIHLSRAFGGPLGELAEKVKSAFDLELSFIISAIRMPRPDDDGVKAMTKPLSDMLDDILEFRNSNRHVDQFFNHLATISESVVALSWISLNKPAKPCQFIREMKDAGDYFGNRVLSANRSNEQHVSWINKWRNVLIALEKYVKMYHSTGFVWGASNQGAATGGGSPPPPPPPPPPELPPQEPPTGGEENRSALMSQINAKGDNITQILRPVRLDPESRARGVEPVPIGDPTGHALRPHAPAPPPVVHPPKLQLEGRKWRVEYQRENYALVIESTDMAESIAMFKCENVGLEARNKMNGISIDTVKRSTIALNDVISSVELIRCSNVNIQCNGTVPLISLDNCDSVQIFLTDSSIGVELISSNSTSLNVCILEPDGTYVELPVPEQIRTVILNGKLHSTALDKM